jgi:hypothetical protein
MQENLSRFSCLNAHCPDVGRREIDELTICACYGPNKQRRRCERRYPPARTGCTRCATPASARRGKGSPNRCGGPNAEASACAGLDRQGAAQPSLARQQEWFTGARRIGGVVSLWDARVRSHRGVTRGEVARKGRRSVGITL